MAVVVSSGVAVCSGPGVSSTAAVKHAWQTALKESTNDGYEMVASRVQIQFETVLRDVLKSGETTQELVSLRAQSDEAMLLYTFEAKRHAQLFSDKLREIGQKIREILVSACDQDVLEAAIKFYGFDVVEGKSKYKGVQGALRSCMERVFCRRVCYAIDAQGKPVLKCEVCNTR